MEAVVDKTSQIAKDFIAVHQKEAKEKEAAAEAAKAKGDEKAEAKGAAKDEKQKTEGVKKEAVIAKADDVLINAKDGDLSAAELAKKKELVSGKDNSGINKRKEEIQREIDGLISTKKALGDDVKALKERDQRIEALERENASLKTPGPKKQDVVKTEADLINKLIEEDKDLPREQKREMPREELEEWLIEDVVAAHEWMSERSIRRRDERQSAKEREANLKTFEEFSRKQNASRAKLVSKFPGIVPNQQRVIVLQQRGLTNKQIVEELKKENKFFRMADEIVKSDPKYVTQVDGPELVMIEMEKRLAEAGEGDQEAEDDGETITLTKAELARRTREAIEMEDQRRKSVDSGAGGSNAGSGGGGKTNDDPVYQQQLKIAKARGYSKEDLDRAIARRKTIPGANTR